MPGNNTLYYSEEEPEHPNMLGEEDHSGCPMCGRLYTDKKEEFDPDCDLCDSDSDDD
jgi:hypothetical protein